MLPGIQIHVHVWWTTTKCESLGSLQSNALPPCSKHDTSGVVYAAFREKVRAILKDLLDSTHANKSKIVKAQRDRR